MKTCFYEQFYQTELEIIMANIDKTVQNPWKEIKSYALWFKILKIKYIATIFKQECIKLLL
jgi:hypothetical protein